MTDDPDRISRLEEALRLGLAMREAQARYFKERSRESLIASKAAERAFDDTAKAVLAEARSTASG